MRAEKKRSREESSKIAERCSIKARISPSSVSVSCAAVAWWLIFGTLVRLWSFHPSVSLLPMRSHRRRWSRLFGHRRFGRPPRLRAELRQRFVELFGELHHVAHRGSCLTGSLGGLPRDTRNNLHRVRYAFRAAYLLFRRERNFLHQLRRLPYHARNSFERLSGLICEARPHFHFSRSFFHDYDRFVRLRLDGFDECRNVFRSAA